MLVPQNLSALIVDDNAYARVLASAVLVEAGIGRIAEADGGADALLRLMSERFDLVLLDWYMPEISGAGIMRVLRDRRFGHASRTPVILTTAYASRDNVDKARAMGVNEVLVKPFRAEHVSACLWRIFGGTPGTAEAVFV